MPIPFISRTMCWSRSMRAASSTPDCRACGRTSSMCSTSGRKTVWSRSGAGSAISRPCCRRSWAPRAGCRQSNATSGFRRAPRPLVGAFAKARASECDERLAARAAAYLGAFRNVAVVHGDGCEDIGEPADVIIVHAGFSQPHPLWLRSLRPRGRLLVPLTQRDREGAALKITRKGKGFEAEAVQQIRIFPGQGRGVTALDDRVADWWQRASALAPLRFRGIEQGLPSDG